MEERSKSGQGAFWLRVNDDGSVETRDGDETRAVMKFDTVTAAHDWHRDCSDNPSDWNIAYHLEDFETA